MGEREPDNHRIYTGVNNLVTFGVEAQTALNCLAADEERKQAGAMALAVEMDQRWPYFGVPVRLAGEQLYQTTYIAQGTDPGGLDDEAATGYEIRGGQTLEGTSLGFGYREMPVVCEGETIGSRFVICHVLRVGSASVVLQEDDTLSVTEAVAYFPIASSRIRFLVKGMMHNVLELRQSESELYSAVDSVVYDEYMPLGDKLYALHETLQANGFSDLPVQEQDEVLSYLDSCELFRAPRMLRVAYAVQSEDEIVGLHDTPVQSVFHGFVRTDYYEFYEDEERPGAFVPVLRGQTIGMGMTLYVDDETSFDVAVPLNQSIGIADKPVARRIARAVGVAAV